MTRKLSPIITGTLCLSAAGIITRFMGFLYKIWLGNLISPEELGLYQLIFPVFAICLSLCGYPFQTVISKFTAQYQEENLQKSSCYLKLSVSLSCLLAFLCAVVLLVFRQQIAASFLLNERCSVLLPYLACAIPLSAIHNCLSGWYYGQKKTAIPAAANLAEQGGRMLFVYLLLQISPEFRVIQVAWALAAGELFSASLCVFSCLLTFRKTTPQKFPACQSTFSKQAILRDIFVLSWPLVTNRLIMSILQSVEAVMIPSRLILYGYSETTALAMYGTLNGMALSFIMFPTAFTGSFSLMLLPDIAKACSQHRTSYLQKVTVLSLGISFFIGCLFTAAFFLFGKALGEFCFPGTLAGTYIQTLSWLCPFLYSNHVLTSILHGMGMSSQTLKTQLAGLTLRLGVTVFLIPLWGIQCYFLAILGSQILMNFCNLHCLLRHIHAV